MTVAPELTKAAPQPQSQPRTTPLSVLNDLADVVIAFFKPLAVPMLRIALGVVYIWFGILKIAGVSPIGDLVAAMLPFLPHDVAVVGMGWAEALLGAALIIGFGVPWISLAMILHLLGTFGVFLFQPAIVHNGNPFVVTLEGEFILKNLVLIAALIVVATHSKPRLLRKGAGS